MCLGSFKFWKKRQRELDQPSPHPRPTVASTVVPVSSVPVASAATAEPQASTNDICPALTKASPSSQSSPSQTTPPSKAKRQEQLWDRAYNQLKEDETKLHEAYEEIISSKAPYMDESLNKDQQVVLTSAQEKWDQMRKTAQEGLDRTQRSAELQGTVDDFFEMVTPIKGIVDRIMPVVPQAQVPWLAVSLTFEIFSQPFKQPGINRAGLLNVISKMQEYMSLSDYVVDDNGLQSDLHRKLEKDTIALYQALLSYQIKSIYCFHKNELKRFVRNIFKVDDWTSQLENIKAAEALIWEDIQKFQNQVMVDHLRKQSLDAQRSLDALTEMSRGVRGFIQDQQEREHEKDNKACLQHLKLTDPSSDKERILDGKGTLLRESYSWVIDHPQFRDWKTNTQHRRLWIRGDTGKGKTMLLCGIIEELEKDPFRRLCYFFCQATEEKLRDGKSVLRGLLFHLIKQYPWLISHVRKDYDDSGQTLFNDHNAWQALRKIFKSVLNDESLDEVIIVVDALDECMVHREELLEFICDISAGSRAKLIVSSRPSLFIQQALQEDGPSATTLALELNNQLIADAVQKFIDRRVKDLAKGKLYQHNPDISKTIASHLTNNAESTFLWVALVCQALANKKVCRRDHVMDILKNSPPGLYNLYDRMLENIGRESMDFSICKEVLAINSVLIRPVTLEELLGIMDANVASKLDVMELEQIIMSCGSFIHLQKGVVYFIHQSAVDFLLKDDRLPSIADRHRSVFQNALRALQASSALKRNIYNLRDPGVAHEDINTTSPDPLLSLRYPCVHWVDHLHDHFITEGEEGGPSPLHAEHISSIYTFLRIKFLFWIEALSLLQNVPRAMRAIKVLQMLLEGKSSSAEQPIRDFLHDANRFLLYFRYVIGKYPLQIYAACLVFSPKESILKRCFKSEAPKWVTVANGLDSTWNACLQTLSAHKSSLVTVVYSSDDQSFISGSKDGTLKVWDAGSGTCIHTHDTCSRITDYCAAFSTDGESFVLGSDNGLVEFGRSSAMAISSDGYTFAYLQSGNRILIWNRDTEISFYTFPPPENAYSLALSADGKYLAATTREGCIIWETLDEDPMMLPTEYIVTSADWSRDKLSLATVGKKGFVEVWVRVANQWNSKFKVQARAADQCHYEIDCMTLSLDATLVVAGSLYDIFIWNVETGALAWAMNGVSGIRSVSLSSDNLRLLTGFGDNTVKIWDLSEYKDSRSGFYDGDSRDLHWSDADRFTVYFRGAEETRVYGNNTRVGMRWEYPEVFAISRDGRQLAWASCICLKITIWDTQTGKLLRELDHNTEEVLLDPHDSKSVEERKTERSIIWSELTEINNGYIYPDSLAFGNSFQLASSVSGLIKIWDTSDGRCIDSLELGDSRICAMAFSKTGRWLAAVSCSQISGITTIELWDTVDRNCMTIRPPKSETFQDANALSFSADSLLLAVSVLVGSSPIVYILDLRSGTILHKFKFNSIGMMHAQFDSHNERVLHTEHGSIDIEEAKGSEEMNDLLRGYSLAYDNLDQWIKLNGERLLWIPDEYRTISESDKSPFIDGLRIIWTRGSQSPVQLFFTAQD
ncbi:hypothetical protein FPOA_00195 [Fusarium poae]|uniref:NACHT domain-containing protein n=1 Tax=Fusarium poae TaxID=36050 RepID=A0A1B8B0I5_FUSPO|nr:hypothetical protein FPOA_00195 [Fusarium poae]